MIAIDSICKRIDSKNWETVAELWQEYIINVQFPVSFRTDYAPADEELSAIYDETKEAERKQTQKEHYYHISGIQYAVFRDAVILYYKALNSIKSAQCSQKSGYKSWSIMNYYQASFFLVKSYLFLNGVWVHTTIDSKNMVADIFPAFTGKSGKELLRLREGNFCKILVSKLLEHWEVWSLFKRVLNVSAQLPIDDKYLRLFQRVSAKDFAKQRNALIYQNREWLFEDLKTELVDLNYGASTVDLDRYGEDDSFTVHLSFVLLQMVNSLIDSLRQKSNYLEEEYSLMQTACTNENNSIFRNFTESNIGVAPLSTGQIINKHQRRC